jgi:hypothetical protein
MLLYLPTALLFICSGIRALVKYQCTSIEQLRNPMLVDNDEILLSLTNCTKLSYPDLYYECGMTDISLRYLKVEIGTITTLLFVTQARLQISSVFMNNFE